VTSLAYGGQDASPRRALARVPLVFKFQSQLERGGNKSNAASLVGALAGALQRLGSNVKAKPLILSHL
jgi:hypothetical protein